ncbi:MAG: NfeD family protein [Chloroflexi bacterium]|nr:NfeD family protein [Chloroflexota bacterium]
MCYLYLISILGGTGIVENELNPEGFIKIHGELWKAVTAGERLEKGSRVIVTRVDGLKLYVKKAT